MTLLSKLSEEIYHLNRLSLCEYAFSSKIDKNQCVKSVRIRSFSVPYFPAFELNTDQKYFEYPHFSRSAQQGDCPYDQDIYSETSQ